jgi:hypothetical protein
VGNRVGDERHLAGRCFGGGKDEPVEDLVRLATPSGYECGTTLNRSSIPAF